MTDDTVTRPRLDSGRLKWASSSTVKRYLMLRRMVRRRSGSSNASVMGVMMSYSFLQRWKDNFKGKCYQEWLTRASPGGLAESAVQHMISINNKQLTEELASERRKVNELTDEMRAIRAAVTGLLAPNLTTVRKPSQGSSGRVW